MPCTARREKWEGQGFVTILSYVCEECGEGGELGRGTWNQGGADIATYLFGKIHDYGVFFLERVTTNSMTQASTVQATMSKINRTGLTTQGL